MIRRDGSIRLALQGEDNGWKCALHVAGLSVSDRAFQNYIWAAEALNVSDADRNLVAIAADGIKNSDFDEAFHLRQLMLNTFDFIS
jgi:hypothetical protein